MKYKITLYAEGRDYDKFNVYSFAGNEREAVEKLIANYPNFAGYIIDKIERLK